MKQCHLLAASIAAATLSAQAQETNENSLEEMLVVGQRAMMTSAIESQRKSDVLKSVITRDSIGNFPDQNVAESVRRLSGVNVVNDQGEGRFIAVRGLDPSLNAASVNGTRLPAPESDTRQVALDVIPSELVESIEVVKTLTADMDADTIGASIQINTTRAFDRKSGFVTAKAEQGYNDLNEAYSPKFSVDFSQPLSERIGIAGGISFENRETSTDNMEVDGWDETDGGVVYADAVEYRDYDVERERQGASLGVDFKLNDDTSLYARSLYSRFDDTEERRRLVFEMDEEPSSGDASTATFLSGDGEISVRRGLKDRYETQTIKTFEVGGETSLEGWKFDYKASWAQARETEKDTFDPTRFRNDFDEAGQLGVTFDYSDLDFTGYSITQGADAFFDPSTYEIDKIERTLGRAEDEETAFQFDATHSMELASGTLEIKGGMKLRQREKSFDLYLEVLEDFDGDYSLADVTGSQSYGLASIDPLPSLARVRSFNADNLSRFEINQLDTDLESEIEDFAVDEDIYAGYLMGRWEANNLMVVGGLRYERTRNDVAANLVELVEEGGVRNGEVLDDDTLFVTGTGFDNDYDHLLPSLSVKWSVQEDVIVRGGVFKSVVRPGMAKLAPRFSVEEADDGEREGEFGNPDLEPYEAWNLDAGVEYYFAESAVLQAGVFFKTIENFIVDVEFSGADAPFNGVFNGIAFDEAVIPLNGDDAEVAGFEFSYQQAFDSGLLLGLNYTYTDSEGDIGDRTIPLPFASENTYNAMLGYEKGPISARLTATYRDEMLEELGGAADEDRWTDEHLQIDLTASYQVAPQVKLYSKFVNLNDEPYLAFQRGPESKRLLQYEEYSWTGKIGVQVTF